jgi:hypothetical protein
MRASEADYRHNKAMTELLDGIAAKGTTTALVGTAKAAVPVTLRKCDFYETILNAMRVMHTAQMGNKDEIKLLWVQFPDNVIAILN